MQDIDPQITQKAGSSPTVREGAIMIERLVDSAS